MSWFNRRPKTRDPVKTAPRDASPLTEKLLEESKQAVRKTPKPKKYKQHLIQNKLSVNNNKHFSTTTRKILQELENARV